MHPLLLELAKFIGTTWARSWLEQARLRDEQELRDHSLLDCPENEAGKARLPSNSGLDLQELSDRVLPN